MPSGPELLMKALGLDPEVVKKTLEGIPQIMANVDRRLTEIANEQLSQRAILNLILAQIGVDANGGIGIGGKPPAGSETGAGNAQDDGLGNADGAT